MSTGRAIERLRALLRIPTVSRSDPADEDDAAFASFRTELERHYPLTHRHLERELVDGGSLLFRWPGRGEDEPVVLMAHYDVVPADEPGWRHPPFAAEVVDDPGDEPRVWARGAIDDKGALVAILEAVESRLADGYVPASDVYLSFGHNEETAGSGAPAIVALLARRGIRPRLVLDEGGAVVTGVFPGVDRPIAVVGVTEKGIAGVELAVRKPGGHASTPVRDGATARLARAILRLDRHPARARLSEPTFEMIRALAPHVRGPLRPVFRWAGLFRPLLAVAFARLSPETAAMVRTTRAVTRLRGSAGDNVIAESATAMVNVRIAVGSSIAEAVDEIRRTIADPAVEVRVVQGSEPSPVSPASGAAWQALGAAISEVFPDAVVAPYVMLQASDSRHFTRISDHVYRFLPFDLTRAERETLHAMDESIRISTFERAVEFFRVLVTRL